MEAIKSALLIFILVSTNWCLLEAKVYKRCELARALRDRYHFPADQVPTWMCICDHESHYNTAAVNRNSGDHGIFQISELYWCSKSRTPGKACHATCAQFENDDISDDAACVKKIFDQTKRQSGNGFTAWTTYKFCKGDQRKYTQGCF